MRDQEELEDDVNSWKLRSLPGRPWSDPEQERVQKASERSWGYHPGVYFWKRLYGLVEHRLVWVPTNRFSRERQAVGEELQSLLDAGEAERMDGSWCFEDAALFQRFKGEPRKEHPQHFLGSLWTRHGHITWKGPELNQIFGGD